MNSATEVPMELAAAITAALAVTMDSAPSGFVIRSIQPLTPVATGAAAWLQTGRLEQHLVRSQVQLRRR